MQYFITHPPTQRRGPRGTGSETDCRPLHSFSPFPGTQLRIRFNPSPICIRRRRTAAKCAKGGDGVQAAARGQGVGGGGAGGGEWTAGRRRRADSGQAAAN